MIDNIYYIAIISAFIGVAIAYALPALLQLLIFRSEASPESQPTKTIEDYFASHEEASQFKYLIGLDEHNKIILVKTKP